MGETVELSMSKGSSATSPPGEHSSDEAEPDGGPPGPDQLPSFLSLGGGFGLLSSLMSAVEGTAHGAQRVARHVVSGSKRRVERDGFDLDLTYVTPRIVALGLPSSGLLETMYRNPLPEVRAYMDKFHRADGYAMCNLCDERDYSNDDWPDASRIMRFPYPDHHPPALAALHSFVCRACAYLSASDTSVLAVHCKAGKGRTGVMICSLLMRLRLAGCATADDVLSNFRRARTTDHNAVNQPSQARIMACAHATRPTAPQTRPPDPGRCAMSGCTSSCSPHRRARFRRCSVARPSRSRASPSPARRPTP